MSALAGEIESAIARAIAPLVERIDAIAMERAAPTPKAKRFLTIADLTSGYNIGRREITRLIETGKMRAVQRTARGGRQCWMVDRAEAERVLAGQP